MKHLNSLAATLAAALAIAVAGCGDADSTHAVDETRALDRARPGQEAPKDPHAGLVPATMPEGFVHPPIDGAAAPGAAAASAPKAALRWTAPDGWTQGPAKSMRLVSFSPMNDPRVDCFVTVLGGDGGGLAANVNRWRQELKLAPLSDADVAALPKVQVLGREAPMAEIDGGALGLYGVVCPNGAETVFVKMTGPMEALRADRDTFIEFCKSLSQK